MVLHLEQVDELGHPTALLDDLLQVEVGVGDEFVDSLLVGEDAVLIRVVVLEHTQVRLSWHQKAVFYDVDQAEA